MPIRPSAVATALTVAFLTASAAAQVAPAPGGRDAPAPDPFVAAPAAEKDAGQDAAWSPLELFGRSSAALIGSVAPFAAASLIAFWFGAERIVVLRRGRVIPRPFVRRFLDLLKNGQLDAASALELCEENGSPVAHVFAHGVRKWGRASVEVEQAIIDGGERQVAQLRRHLRIINGVATVTPLMGLLGTIVGMMFSFFGMAGGAGRAEQLALGIVTALSTTALGLTIAIPCLILYMYLVGRIDALVMEMDDLAQQVVHRISAEGLAARPVERPAPPRSRAKPTETVRPESVRPETV